MTVVTILRLFAFLLFLFLPSLTVLMFAGFVLNSTSYFAWLGLPTLFGNGIFLFIKPVKARIGAQLRLIAGLG